MAEAVVLQVQVVTRDGTQMVNFEDIVRANEDATTLDNTVIVGRCEKWLDLADGALAGFVVDRVPGGLVVREEVPYG